MTPHPVIVLPTGTLSQDAKPQIFRTLNFDCDMKTSKIETARQQLHRQIHNNAYQIVRATRLPPIFSHLHLLGIDRTPLRYFYLL